MKKTLPILIAILILLLIIPLVYFFISQNSANSDNFQNNFNEEGSNNPAQDSQPETFSFRGGFGGGGSSGGSGSGSDSAGAGGPVSGFSTKKSCSKEQISYSISEIEKTESCLQIQENSCIEKEILCSATIRNHDDSIGGIFGITFTFYNIETNTILGEKISSKNINAESSEQFTGSLILQGQDAEKNISCYVFTNSVPTREVC